MQKQSKIHLYIMMFVQMLMLAVWWVPLAAYLDNIGISGSMKASILSTMAFGCFLSPTVGFICDRYFNMERVLFSLNLASGLCLLVAAMSQSPIIIFVMLFLTMFLYMPTWGIVNTIALANSSNTDFPKIRVWGTIGWVAAAIFSLIALKFIKLPAFDGTVYALYTGAACHIIGALFALFLPATPPKGTQQRISLLDACGLRTFTLMKDKNFAIFSLVSFLVMIPFGCYFAYSSSYLQHQGFEFITLTLNLGQGGEIFFMLTVSWILIKLGNKFTMLLGLTFLVVRFVAFYFNALTNVDVLLYLAIITQGLIFGYFNVAGQMYMDKVAPVHMKAQAQGFIFLLTFGLGMTVGNFITAWTLAGAQLPDGSISDAGWSQLWLVMTLISIAAWLLFAFGFNPQKMHAANQEYNVSDNLTH